VTQAQLIRDIDQWAIWFSFLASALFTPVTSVFWPWWQTSWGWNIVTLELCVSLALLYPWLHYAFGLTVAAYPFAWMQAASIALVGAVVIWRTVLIWQTQRHEGG
jgi:hypothetical protein